jgi:hypothetical protein
MAAIVTTNFRFINADNFIDDITASANNVYIGIGKHDPWSDSAADMIDDPQIPTPGDSIQHINEAYEQLIGITKVEAGSISRVIPRVNWTSGTVYTPWQSDKSDIFDTEFYVLTDEFKVYKLLSIAVAGTPSTVQPRTTDVYPAAGADGYQWMFMYQLGTSDVQNFLTTSYMPVKTIDVSAGVPADAFDAAQYDAQVAAAAAATNKGIHYIKVENGGSGYTTATVSISGDGTGAAATATIDGGVITSIAVTSEGTDYSQAIVTITGDGTGATATAMIEPGNGHGTDPVKELGGFYVCVRTTLDPSTSSITTENDFRQISMIKNPTDSGGVITDSDVQTLKYIRMNTGSSLSSFEEDLLITQTGGNEAQALVTYVDNVNGRIYFTQNDKTGYEEFVVSNQIVQATSGATANVHGSIATVDPDMNDKSGEMLFLENRDPISRSATQIEDLKLIIEF